MKKRHPHKNIPQNHFEEEQGQGGFYGPVSYLIKKKPSTRWSKIEGELKPRLFDLNPVPKSSWIPLLENSTLRIFFYRLLKPDHACRVVDGDMLYFCHEGQGVLLTEYGLLDYFAGQYLLIPKCLTHFIIPHKPSSFLAIKSLGSHFREPDRALLGRNALYDSSALIKPCLDKLYQYLKGKNLSVREVIHYHNNQQSLFTYKDCIFDVVEWHGDLFPFTLDMKDIMPVMSHRAHLPPSVHSTFLTDNFIVCSFLPRPLESDKDALKLPFYHQNTDYDEVIFYHKGLFFSRDNLKPGTMSFHPAGFPHGPHPQAIKAIEKQSHTNEYAVMIDSKQALRRTKELLAFEVSDYWKSWQIK